MGRRVIAGMFLILLVCAGCAGKSPGLTAPATQRKAAESGAQQKAPGLDMPYGRSFLSTEEQALYDWLERLALQYDTIARITPEFPVGEETLLRIWGYLSDDNPLLYWAELEWKTDESGVITAVALIGEAAQARHAAKEIRAAADLLLEDIEDTGADGVIAVHDALIRRITYDQSESQPHRGDLYGGLVNGMGVCDGYSRSFQYLMGRMGIPCVWMRGMSMRQIPHSWNAVFLNDMWYYVDLTWDDPGEGKPYVYHDYLLVTGGEIAETHHPAPGQYPVLPVAEDPWGSYYARRGYGVTLSQGGDPGALLGRAFAAQLIKQPLTADFRQVFTEVKLMEDGEAYLAGRDYFKNNLFEVLRAMERELVGQGQPIDIRVTDSVGYQFNDRTRVLTLFPEVCEKR